MAGATGCEEDGEDVILWLVRLGAKKKSGYEDDDDLVHGATVLGAMVTSEKGEEGEITRERGMKDGGGLVIRVLLGEENGFG